MGEGVVVSDVTGKLVFANAAAERISGHKFSRTSSDEWVARYGIFARDGSTLMPTDELPSVKALRGEPSSSVELVIRNQQVPEGIVVLATARPLRSATGELVGAITVFRDLTELRRTQGQLERALDELRVVHERQADLTTFLVHDLKNPLAIIQTYSQLLLEEPRSASDVEALTDIQIAATTLHRMIMDILDVAVGESGALVLARTEINLAELLEELRQAMQGGTNASLHVLPLAPGLSVSADREYLRRVLQNLVDNCMKYGPRDGTIALAARADGDSLELSVADEGPGVPEALRESIFDKFARVERDIGRSRGQRRSPPQILSRGHRCAWRPDLGRERRAAWRLFRGPLAEGVRALGAADTQSGRRTDPPSCTAGARRLNAVPMLRA